MKAYNLFGSPGDIEIVPWDLQQFIPMPAIPGDPAILVFANDTVFTSGAIRSRVTMLDAYLETTVPSSFVTDSGEANNHGYTGGCALDTGGFVVIYQRKDNVSNSRNVYFILYDNSGIEVLGETLATVTTAGDQSRCVCSSTDTGFVIAWTGSGTGDAFGCFFRFFDFAGGALSGEIRANVSATKSPIFVRIARLLSGNAAIVWYDTSTGGSLVLSIVNASGVVAGDVAITGTASMGAQEFDACGLADGRFAVAWRRTSPAQKVQMQFFSSDGSPSTSVIDVVSDGLVKTGIAISGLSNGGAVIGYGGNTGTITPVYRRVEASGALGPEVSYTTGDGGSSNNLAPNFHEYLDGSILITKAFLGISLNGVYLALFDNTDTLVKKKFLYTSVGGGSGDGIMEMVNWIGLLIPELMGGMQGFTPLDASDDGLLLTAGAHTATIQGMANAGAGFSYSRAAVGDFFVLSDVFTSSDVQAGDEFGITAPILNNTNIAAGSWRDDDLTADSGSGYLLNKPSAEWVDIHKFSTGTLGESMFPVAFITGGIWCSAWSFNTLEGRAHLFDNDGVSAPTVRETISNPDSANVGYFSAAMRVISTTEVLIGSDYGVFLYKDTGSGFTLAQTIRHAEVMPADGFGLFFDISSNKTLIIASPLVNGEEGEVYVYDYVDGVYEFVTSFGHGLPAPVYRLGRGICCVSDDEVALSISPAAGDPQDQVNAVLIYSRAAGWQPVGLMACPIAEGVGFGTGMFMISPDEISVGIANGVNDGIGGGYIFVRNPA